MLQGRGGIFISYRREQTAGDAGRLYDRLSGYFGQDRVFIDVDSIEFGRDFVAAVRKALDECEILLAIIGQGWLTATDNKNRRRIDSPDDWVRIEVETALQRDVRVVAVLVEGAKAPDADDLPPSLRPLARRQAFELSHADFNADVGRLIKAVNKVFTEERRQQETAWQPPIPDAVYDPPSYGTPAYGSPAYGSPPYRTPAHDPPPYRTPTYDAPGSDRLDNFDYSRKIWLWALLGATGFIAAILITLYLSFRHW